MAPCLAGETHHAGRVLSRLLCSLPLPHMGSLPYLWLGRGGGRPCYPC